MLTQKLGGKQICAANSKTKSDQDLFALVF